MITTLDEHLTLTSVVFELLLMQNGMLLQFDLTLTSVVFEYGKWKI